MKKHIFSVLGIIFLSSLFSMMALKQYYTRSMPQSPEQETGRTVSLSANYGLTVYVTPDEKRKMNFVYVVFAVTGSSVLIYVIVASVKASAQ